MSPINAPRTIPKIQIQPPISRHTPVYSTSTVSLPVSQSTTSITTAYRNRYAAYLAATFNISLEAAQSDTDFALAAPRRASQVSEADAYRS